MNTSCIDLSALAMKSLKYGLVLLVGNLSVLLADIWSDLLLPDEHVPFFFTNNPDIRDKCAADSNCPFKVYI